MSQFEIGRGPNPIGVAHSRMSIIAPANACASSCPIRELADLQTFANHTSADSSYSLMIESLI